VSTTPLRSRLRPSGSDGDSLERLPFGVSLARQATSIVRHNLVLSLGVSAVLVVAAIVGWVRISEAVIIHEGSTLFVVANALRLLAHDRG
jgi:Cd2+/Zn2+-exporting ATPase